MVSEKSSASGSSTLSSTKSDSQAAPSSRSNVSDTDLGDSTSRSSKGGQKTAQTSTDNKPGVLLSTKPSTPPSKLKRPPPPPADTMSKLSQGLKTLINAPFARPNYTVPDPTTLKPVLQNLAASASTHNVGVPAWLTIATATSMTMNAPNAMLLAWQQAQHADRSLSPVVAAELQREVGLKCISFNGIPRAINVLGAYTGGLPADVRAKLSKTPTRAFSPANIEARKADGRGLWDSVYYGFEHKLLDKLADSHPDLPVHILHSHYAGMLSNPSRAAYVEGEERPREAQVGRVLTSLVAVACLRAQTGVGPQVVSHIFGLRKAYERGDAAAESEIVVQGGDWLSSEEGNRWLVEWIDELVRGIGTAQEGERADAKVDSSSTYAPGMEKAKL